MSELTDFSTALAGIASRHQAQLSHLGSTTIAWRSAVHWDGPFWVSLAEEASPGETVPLLTGGQSREVRVVAFDAVTGLVLLESSENSGPGIATYADSDASLGSLVLTLAYPSPEGPEASLGIIRVRPSHGRYFQTDANLFQGFAGSLVMDAQERVIGIIAQVGRGNQSWAVPISRLRDRVAALQKFGSLRSPRIGVEVESINLRQGGRGLLVRKLVPNGPAETAGIRQGDILLKADELPLENSSALIEALAGLPINASISLLRLRGDSTEVVSVLPDFRLGGKE